MARAVHGGRSVLRAVPVARSRAHSNGARPCFCPATQRLRARGHSLSPCQSMLAIDTWCNMCAMVRDTQFGRLSWHAGAHRWSVHTSTGEVFSGFQGHRSRLAGAARGLPSIPCACRQTASRDLSYIRTCSCQVVLRQLMPCIRELVNDTSQHVRAALASVVSGLATVLQVLDFSTGNVCSP